MAQRLPTIYPVGTLLQGRYSIEDLLGKGGFGAVYLVKDQQEGGQLFALKELREQDEDEKKRLLFESEILRRLDHRSLPRVRGVFEENDRLYMIMDYVDGPNLEVLRKRQPERRFSLSEVLTLLRPIFEALTYLHQQHPPLIHRDIKPSNMIVPQSGAGASLVDFGIAREYQDDATTTAVRHCSPGYSSPEQYSGMGTNPRADIYGLAATCHTLLCGAPPADALQRLTKVASRHPDPLIDLHEAFPTIPTTASRAIQRGLALNQERRFATSEEFWEALSSEQEIDSVSERTQTDPVIPLPEAKESTTPAARPGSGRKTRLTLVVILMLLTICLVAGFWFYAPHFSAMLQNNADMTSVSQSGLAHAPVTAYPLLAASYQGTLDNLLTHTNSTISLTAMKQNSQTVTGMFIRDHATPGRSFSGVVDASQHILLTVAGQQGQASLFFDGVIHDDGSIVGNYCSVDISGQCAGGEYGLWSVAP